MHDHDHAGPGDRRHLASTTRAARCEYARGVPNPSPARTPAAEPTGSALAAPRPHHESRLRSRSASARTPRSPGSPRGKWNCGPASAPVVLGDREFAESGFDDPPFLKFRLFDFVDDADDLLYFDADTVCLEPWDPTPLFGSERIACVRERMVPVVPAESAEWSSRPPSTSTAACSSLNRRHHAQWLRRAEALRHARPTVLHEQSPLNAARCELGIPLNWLDRRYNWLGFGTGSLSHDMPVVMAHRLAPDRQELNVAYFNGDYPLFEPRFVIDDASAKTLHGCVFNFRDGAGGGPASSASAKTARSCRPPLTRMPPATGSSTPPAAGRRSRWRRKPWSCTSSPACSTARGSASPPPATWTPHSKAPA